MRRRTIVRRAAGIVALAATMLLAVHGVAEGHAVLLASSPATGSRLATSPAQVSLTFSEPLEPSMAHLALMTPDGRHIELVGRGDPHDVHALVASIDGTLPAGAYHLVWHVVSADGHPVQGSIAFAVGATAIPPADLATLQAMNDGPATWGPAVGGAPLLPALLRGAALTSLMALAGMLGFAAAAPAAGRGSARHRIIVTLAVAAPLLLAAHAGAWMVNASPDHQLTAAGIEDAFASATLRVELWRIGLATLALWALLLARRARLAFVFALFALLVSGASGHSMAMHPTWTVPARVLHLLAGAAWIGGLLSLLVVREDDSSANAEIQRVSAVALWAAIVVTMSGIVQALLFLPSPLDVVRTFYGAVVLAKVAGLLVLVAFGAFHRYRVLPRLAVDGVAHRLRASVRREIGVMVVVMLLGGLLAYVPPAGDAAASSSTSHPIVP